MQSAYRIDVVQDENGETGKEACGVLLILESKRRRFRRVR